VAWATTYNVTDAEMSHHLVTTLVEKAKRSAAWSGYVVVAGAATITLHYEATETTWRDPETGESIQIPPQVSLRIEVPTEEN